MPKSYTEAQREEMYRAMRERMAQADARRNGAPHESAVSWHRRQKLQGLPADLQFFRVNEIAEILAVHPTTIMRWFKGRMVIAGEKGAGHVRRRRTLLISRAAFMEWLRERTPAPR